MHLSTSSALLFWLQMLLVSPLALQAQINGVINRYTPVISADFCNNLVVIEDPTGFSVGDRVMLIQMQGAVLDSTDSPSYGDISDFGQSGKYEFLNIAEININILIFEQAMVNRYDGPGLQMIRVPVYNNVTVEGGALSAQPWDGLTGGVLAFEVTGTLTLNDDIDVSGLGFRGGLNEADPECSPGVEGYEGYRCADRCGGRKGEGIGRISAEPYGRGRPANGGGGGNDHLSGGGGGANFALGGVGGRQANIAPGDCRGEFPGLGGRTLFYSNSVNRAFMGGGGGAGDGAGPDASSGGHGGGIIFMKCGELIGNGQSIRSNGAAPLLEAGAGGGGGGGAGGTLLLEVDTYTGPVTVQLRGGEGGNVNNGNDPELCAGPGGGGSGGAFWVSGADLPLPVAFNLAGGIAGTTVNPGAPAECGANGAGPGSAGDHLTGLQLVASDLLFEPLEAVLSQDTFVCSGDSVFIGVLSASGTGELSYLWNTGDTTAMFYAGPLQSSAVFSVNIFDERGCSIVRDIKVENGRGVAVSANPTGLLAPGQSVLLQATDDPLWISYTWSPDSFLSTNNGQVVMATPFRSITYCVSALDTLGCLSKDCVDIQVDVLVNMPNAFTPNNDGLNDLFRIPEAVPCDEVLLFQIHNRWGEKVFDSPLREIGWDGTYRGVMQEAGVYVYRIELNCEGDFRKTLKGTLTLLH